MQACDVAKGPIAVSGTLAPMASAETIRTALASVARLREAAAADPSLRVALAGLKLFQARRFAATYPDLAADPVQGPATAFFLDELYGGRDYPERDGQFARIARRLEQTFPADVVDTAVEVAHLHALSETLDHAMAQAWREAAGTATARPMDAGAYVAAWRRVGRRADRQWQLQAVLGLGQTLSRLTRKKALGWMLRMMHAPARAAGLGDLQRFLSLGFDTFGGMAAQAGSAGHFLEVIAEREGAWIAALFDEAPAQVAGRLDRLLATAAATA